MCFHASQTKTTTEIEERFNVARDDENWTIDERDFTFYHSNGFDHREFAIITQQASDILEPAMWGIMPSNELAVNQNEYYKKAAKWGAGLNAKSEKLFDHFIYSDCIFEQRCIIPLDGFFEPYEHTDGNKYPGYIHRNDKELFGMAGIYSITKDGCLTCTILTKDATGLIDKVHNKKHRQPVILHPDLENEWLNDSLNEDKIKELVNIHYPQDELKAYLVSRDIFKRTPSDHSKIIEEVKFDNVITNF